MLVRLKFLWKKLSLKLKVFLIIVFGKGLMHLLIKTCRIEFDGLESFCEIASKEKCMLMLWHNRLIITPFLLSHYTPQFLYTALVSGHRDGEVLSSVINSYRNGRTIRALPKDRYRALQEIIRHVEEGQHIVIITPDGPRGPKYEVKQGIAVAALQTRAFVVPLNWEAKNYWQIKTWDRQRLPKPFTTIKVSFGNPLRFDQVSLPSLDEAKQILKNALP